MTPKAEIARRLEQILSDEFSDVVSQVAQHVVQRHQREAERETAEREAEQLQRQPVVFAFTGADHDCQVRVTDMTMKPT